MIAAVLRLNPLTVFLIVYGLLLAVAVVRKGIHRGESFYSAAPPFTRGKEFHATEKRLSDFKKTKIFFTNYVLILGAVAVGLTGAVVGLLNSPTLLSWEPWNLVSFVVLTLVWPGMWLKGAHLMALKVWHRLYIARDPEAERKRERVAEQRERQAVVIPPYEEQQRLEAKRREHERWKIDGREQLERLGLAGVLDEPELPMSEYYVTNKFTEYGDPLAPFREKFAPLTGVNLRDLLEQENAVKYDPSKTIDTEFLENTSEPESDLLELPPPATPVQPTPRLKALDGVREQTAAPVEDASPTPVSELPKIEGHIAEHLWENLRTEWHDVIDSPVAKAQGSEKPYRGRYVPEQLVLSEGLLEAVLEGRPAGLKMWRYKGQTVDGMLAMDLETVALYPELRTWLQDPENRTRLFDLETDRDRLERLSPFITMSDVAGGELSLGGWRPPTLALTERAWIFTLGYVPNGETTTTRGIKKPLVKVELPVEW